MTTAPLAYVEEDFGILTDDQLYLDCMLVKPANMRDEDLRVLRVWVPRYPLTKTSVVTCARQEVQSYGPDGKIAHLIFDLRGTGESDGLLENSDFQMDLDAIADWADERFGRINFGFLGLPDSDNSAVQMWPLRPGAMMESYHYPAQSDAVVPPTVLYLSTYGNFNPSDDERCAALAGAGYNIFGVDPFRYILHASNQSLLTPEMLWEDFQMLIQMLPSKPIIVAQPLAAGLAMVCTAGVTDVKGLVAIGKAQSGLTAKHIFDNSDPKTFALPRFLPRIAPRPLVMVQRQGHALGGDTKRFATLYQYSQAPNRIERTTNPDADFLLEMIQWVEAKQSA